MNEFKAGDRAVAKVGRNEINVEILAVEEKSYLVRNNAGKEFHAVRLTALPDAKGVGNTDTIAAEPEEITEDDTPNPAPECATQKQEKKRSGYTFYIVLAAVVLLILGFRIWWSNSFGGVEVSGDSMCQTLQSGQNLLMRFVKDGQGLERGDVIVVDVSDYDWKDSQGNKISFLIKRLIAVEGDKIKCTDGQISICYAGTVEYVTLDEPYAYYGGMLGRDETDYDFAEYSVGEGEIFFLGDNRLNSVDSRYQERGGSHLEGELYKATDVYGVVPDWAMEHREILAKIFFR